MGIVQFSQYVSNQHPQRPHVPSRPNLQYKQLHGSQDPMPGVGFRVGMEDGAAVGG